MTRSFYNTIGFDFAANLAEEYFLKTENILGMQEEITYIREELNSRPTPSGYKKLDISKDMDRALEAAKIFGNELTQKVHSFLNRLIEENTHLAQEARQIKAFISSSNDKSFLY